MNVITIMRPKIKNITISNIFHFIITFIVNKSIPAIDI